MEKQFTYTVASPIHHGRLFKIGTSITLTEAEAAGLAGFLDLESKRESDQAATPGAGKTVATIVGGGDTEALTARIAELEGELRSHQEAMATLIEEHDQTVADLTTERDALKAECDKLAGDLVKASKPAAPAPAPKGKK